jgi:hypothetical protein
VVYLLPPLNDTVVVEPEALFSEAKHRTRRRPLLIGGGAALLAAALAIGIMLVTPDNDGAASPPPPGFASGHLSDIESYARNIVRAYSRAPVKTALIYSTTRQKAFDAGTGMDPSPANRRSYVLVFEGQFTSNRSPFGAVPPSGKYLIISMNPPGESPDGGALGIVNTPPGPGMGRPYTLVLK